MAYYDSRLDKYVVRIVYDGAPLSGKTTSLVTLAGVLGNKSSSAVFSPGEASGRTLFFDWMDYEGGLFNGKPIRCQIVTVPGQKALKSRRQAILSTADAVIFVLDSTVERYQQSLEYFRDLPAAGTNADRNAPGILVQANKRDLTSVVSMQEIKLAIGNASNVGIIESSAVSGDGVRHSFVLAVGLALDRITLLQANGAIPHGAEDDIDSGEDLLQWMRASEGSTDLSEGVSIDEHRVEEVASEEDDTAIARKFTALLGEERENAIGVVANDRPKSSYLGSIDRESLSQGNSKSGNYLRDSEETNVVPIPSASVPAGFIWPPVEGRLIVNEIANDADLKVASTNTSWIARSKTWALMSRKTDVFADPTVARPALIELVTNHIKLDGLLSAKRCVALSPDGDKWRLWQVVRNEQSVVAALKNLFLTKDAVRIADLLFRYAELVSRAARLFRSRGVAIPIEASTIGAMKGDPVFLGQIPGADDQVEEGVTSAGDVVGREIRRMFEEATDFSGLNIPHIIDRLKEHARNDTESAAIVDTVSSVLIGH